MNTKHKPATALPLGPEYQRELQSALMIHRDAPDARQDAAYIVHAANAYPRLVEALRGILQGDGASWATRATVARDLLREIGEAA